MSDSANQSADPGAYWFGKYAALFVLPVLILVPIFYEHDGWFTALALYWFVSVAFFAWRANSERVGLWWRIGLCAVMVAGCAYAIAFVYATPGDTDLCYDRISKPNRWSVGVNLGPSPTCEGVPLRDVQVD